MSHIIIGLPYVYDVDSGVRLESKVTIGEIESRVYFEVESKYSDCLCTDRADAFLVALFLLAFVRGESVRVDAPVSEPLMYQINTVLSDFLSITYPDIIPTGLRVEAQSLLPPVVSKGAVGTGISCGIDSLATIFRHLQHECPKFSLTHLCFFDTGSHGKSSNSKSVELYQFRRNLARNFCKKINLPLIEVRSNLSEISTLPFAFNHTYLNASAAMALQSLFETYYYSSGAETKMFLKSTTHSGYYDIYLLPLLSTRSLRFYSGEENFGRFEKTKIIANHPLASDFLNVCNVTGPNCGRCNKCIRTLLALDALGVIDQYRKVFDVDEYQSRKDSHLIYHCKQLLRKDASHQDLDPHISTMIHHGHRIIGRWGYLKSKAGSYIRKVSKISKF